MYQAFSAGIVQSRLCQPSKGQRNGHWVGNQQSCMKTITLSQAREDGSLNSGESMNKGMNLRIVREVDLTIVG